MHLLQVCNVGNICGGTAACAWTIQRALPDFQHSVLFLSPPTAETRLAFANCHTEFIRRPGSRDIIERNPDLVLLHNISRQRLPTPAGPVTIQYLHSLITPAAADLTWSC